MTPTTNDMPDWTPEIIQETYQGAAEVITVFASEPEDSSSSELVLITLIAALVDMHNNDHTCLTLLNEAAARGFFGV